MREGEGDVVRHDAEGGGGVGKSVAARATLACAAGADGCYAIKTDVTTGAELDLVRWFTDGHCCGGCSVGLVGVLQVIVERLLNERWEWSEQ